MRTGAQGRRAVMNCGQVMTAADFDALPEGDKIHFYRCKKCGEMVDMRQLDDVLFHEDHKPRPDIQYGAPGVRLA
jgi:hypothetical protein